jgi:phosphoglycolate phosphatase
MIDLVAFDLDGTLVDSHRDLAAAANGLVTGLGGTPLTDEQVVRMVGEGAAVLVRRALTASGLDPDTPGALDRFLAIYDGCLLDRTLPYPGTEDTLARLKPHHRLAVLTNKPGRATQRILDGLALTHYFDAIVGGDSPFGRKPDPSGLLHIISTCGTSADKTVLVGDSPVDRETARRAGAAICLARFGFGFTFRDGDLDGSEIVLEKPLDVVTAVQTLDCRL